MYNTGEEKMKKVFVGSLLLLTMMLFVSASALATRQGEDVNPNGFPSGEHFNLNIHGKKADFQCPEPYFGVDYNGENHQGEYGEYVLVGTDPEVYEWKYDNSLFIPETSATKEIKIFMESGKKGGRGSKNESLANVLKVTDPCTADFDNDAAVIQLPPNENGYNVYVRALGKPTNDPSFTITEGNLSFVEDEDGNVLFYAGSMGEGWVSSDPNNTFIRTKGQSRATDITSLFNFTGMVCYFDAPESYDGTMSLCCNFGDIDGDGLGEYYDCIIKEGDFCDIDKTEVTSYCVNYSNTWIFNIGDFVQYFWDLDNQGTKLIQVRFYPRP